MKRIFLFSLSLLMASTAIFAQKKECDKKNFEEHAKQCLEHRTKKYIEEFQLDDKSAARFTDLFQAYNKDMFEIHKAHFPERQPRPELKEGEKPAEAPQLSEEEIEKFTVMHFAMERELIDLNERYFKDFREVLKPSQAAKVLHDARKPHDKMHKGECKGECKKDGKHGDKPDNKPDAKNKPAKKAK